MKTPGENMHDPLNPARTEPPHSADESHELLLGELTAALAAEASSSLDALPEAAAARAIHVGEAMVRARASSVTVDANQTAPAAAPRAAQSGRSFSGSRARTLTAWSGWLAAAAMLAVVVREPRAVVAPTPLVPTAAQLHDSLALADAKSVRIAWTATGDSTAVGAEGDVVWSATGQRGVMRIVGLAPNDRTKWQYQLWIFDKNRDERYPVDGGVFDIPAGSREVYVPIDARVPVDEATLFAVTIEPAGGVVVSTRERIALTAGL
jgi:anti-sigma-K factor RskA